MGFHSHTQIAHIEWNHGIMESWNQLQSQLKAISKKRCSLKTGSKLSYMGINEKSKYTHSNMDDMVQDCSIGKHEIQRM